MKKWILVLGMIIGLLGLTACGSKEVTQNYGVTEEQALLSGTGIVESMNQIALSGEIEQYRSEAVIYEALQNYEAAMEDMGEYQEVTGHTVSYEDGITIDLEVKGSKRDAVVEIILDKELNYVSISTNVVYSFGEMMAKAGLNTLMGMGTVFAVLILISFLISGFSLISKVQNKTNIAEEKREPVVQPVEKTAEPIGEEEELSDDLELVAVIAAAVAAYEGAAASDGYVVRSIKRRNRSC